ncbi:MGMT family protein [uncultured Alistipes sp.]|uniref:MGMT family protein n=1 Tax=uncultured Alistipes sp. TaxID=538949 RepID=UPI00260221AC|nr:MGMT family protein [uncultured Alistipes sp.]
MRSPEGNMAKPDYKEFERAVYDVVAAVPPGRVTSYGAIARALGYPLHARLVGRAMGRCDDPAVPAHRVADSRGRLSGRHAFGDPHRMGDRLEAEGVRVACDRVVDWRRVFWDPLDEIRL